MDFGSKLEELNLTRDEMNRLGEALKDDKFRELLSEYAAEISDPENKRRYEEEITQLEKDRGMNVQFIHPEGHHVLKTRGAGGKIFINVCSSQLIDQPSCEAARNRDGKPGQNWRLPFSLTPGRTDRDSGGNSCVIYDVVFHPDALYMAAKSARFLKLIHRTALDAIEDSFHIKLDKDKIKQLKMRYKGVAHPAVIRTPIPGHDQKNRSTYEEDVMSFPYPDENQTAPEPKSSSSQSPEDKQPITPPYTLKYRSVVDLQDYRCSRDSGPGARPREIVITIDVPLLRSAQDADLSVTERRLVLEAPEPAYRLELPLAYPVDEDKGDAKFNKTKKQLTITLPVRPLKTPQISCDETKSNASDQEAVLDHTEPERCDTAAVQRSPDMRFPLASEPPLIDLTTEPQTHKMSNDLIFNRTEPQEPEPDRSVEVVPNNEDEMNISRAVDSSSDASSVGESVRLHGPDEKNPESDATAFLQTDDNALIHQPETPANQQLNPPMNSSPEAEKPLRSSEDCESDVTARLMEDAGIRSEEPAVLRETDPDGSHMTSATLCFQNSLWFDLD
ncbi:Protein kintoun [Anabarilius grahami]|uniref:Protein kintoun n=1 Tax=Anabarilius grahami TaxID=495550 RepID=A0A3N0Z045_ANAGA|nr:Protein kintoun [Anabarilius grahami]